MGTEKKKEWREKSQRSSLKPSVKPAVKGVMKEGKDRTEEVRGGWKEGKEGGGAGKGWKG